jgi:hypothetical protein
MSFHDSGGHFIVSSRVRRISIVLGLLLAVGLVVGGVSANRANEEDAATTERVAVTAPAQTDPYPLESSTTPEDVQLAVYERAYSECASTDLALLASKYKAADTSDNGVAVVVGRAWASYFKAGQDAVGDGRDGCLQGISQR